MKDLFLKLVQISSPSGYEAKVAEFIQSYFLTLGWKTKIDKAGNVIATPKWIRKLPVLLVAHMDTVQKTGDGVKPKFVKGIFKSDGSTILGADNKAGVTILLKIADEITQKATKLNICMTFTVNEEMGEMGSSRLAMDEIKPKLILNVDGGKDPGCIDVMALGQKVFEVSIKGRSAHASVEPEKGINAIVALAKLISGLKIGKDSKGNVLNIGKIIAGDRTNVVPDNALVTGEIRSFSDKEMENMWGILKKQIEKVTRETGAQMRLREIIGHGVPVWESNFDPRLMKTFQVSAQECGLPFQTDRMFACSDANYLARWEIPTININRGGKFPHSHKEQIALKDIEKTKELVLKILANLHSN